MVQEFLLSDCTELVFLDADVSWRPAQLVRLCRHDVDLVGGVYPYRRNDAQEDMPVRMLPDPIIPDERGLLKVEGLPTGFMRIKRVVLETLVQQSQGFWNKEDRRSKIPILFQRTYQEESDTRWGGDLHFCNLWRQAGGEVHADYEMILGHTGKITLTGSLAAALRRKSQTTLKHVAEKIRAGTETLEDFVEARKYVNNHWGALEDVLAISVNLARKADGPIIETGSGLTTILMAAATDQTVWCLEHHGLYAAQLQQMCTEAGVFNINMVMCPMKDGWYDFSADLHLMPKRFALGLNDGPPRAYGPRTGFFNYFGTTIDRVICDDADNPPYRNYLERWAKDHSRDFLFVEPRAAIIGSLDLNLTAATAA